MGYEVLNLYLLIHLRDQFRVPHCDQGSISDTRALLGRISPHLWIPSRPAASTVSIACWIGNSSGCRANKRVTKAAQMRPLSTCSILKIYGDRMRVHWMGISLCVLSVQNKP